jgi:hypothetical protein
MRVDKSVDTARKSACATAAVALLQAPFTKLNEVLGRVCRLLKMMMQIRLAACAAVFWWSSMAPAQAVKSVVGTVSLFKAETAEIEIKPDNGAAVAMKVTADTMAQKVAPGVTDLKKAEAIKVTDVALGDRVLATPEPGTNNLRRIVVMPASEIVKKNEADRMDWVRRGVSGVVAAKNGDQVTLKIRTLTGESQAVVTVTEKTSFKRYAPDSVKFADAKSSKLAEISVGDQVRARGVKSEDGLKVTAEDVVFGTFITKAGTITAVNAEAREITVKDLANNKPLVIRTTADSQIKKMPDMGGMRGGGPPGMGGGGRGMDINAMLERMPPVKLEDLKAGETIVVSSTKGAKSNEVTAIMMLANADGILQMIAAQAGGGRGSGMAGSGGMSGGMDAFGGMGLGGIVP